MKTMMQPATMTARFITRGRIAAGMFAVIESAIGAMPTGSMIVNAVTIAVTAKCASMPECYGREPPGPRMICRKISFLDLYEGKHRLPRPHIVPTFMVGAQTGGTAKMLKPAIVFVVLAFLLVGCNGGQNQPGAVPVGTLTGVVTGPNGPVSGASIALTAADGSQRSAASTADGYFEIDRVPAGTIQLSVSATGFAPWQTNAVITPNATLTQDVRLTPL